jgi:hypothetical protein
MGLAQGVLALQRFVGHPAIVHQDALEWLQQGQCIERLASWLGGTKPIQLNVSVANTCSQCSFLSTRSPVSSACNTKRPPMSAAVR